MDVASTAAAAAGLQRAQTTSAIATEVVKAAAEQDQAIAGLLAEAVEAGKAATRSGPAVAGSAGIVDIKA